MVATLERAREPFASDQRANWQAAAESLRGRNRVWNNSGLLVSPERTGPPHPGLNLIEDQRRAVAITDLTGSQQHLVWDRVDATFTLDRLDDQRRGARADGLLSDSTFAAAGLKPGIIGANGDCFDSWCVAESAP